MAITSKSKLNQIKSNSNHIKSGNFSEMNLISLESNSSFGRDSRNELNLDFEDDKRLIDNLNKNTNLQFKNNIKHSNRYSNLNNKMIELK